MIVLIIISSLKISKKNLDVYLLILISIIRLILDKSIYTWNFFINIIILLIIYRLILTLINGSALKLSKEIFTKEINIEELKPGMVLSESIIKKGKISKIEFQKFLNTFENKSEKIEYIKFKDEYYLKQTKSMNLKKSIIDEEPEGLTLEQIKEIKKIGFKKIRISQTIPFAPFIFFGVIITLLVKGNIIIFLRMLF